MKADAKTEAAVIAVMNKMAESYSQRDIENLVSIFAPDPDHIIRAIFPSRL